MSKNLSKNLLVDGRGATRFCIARNHPCVYNSDPTHLGLYLVCTLVMTVAFLS
jgi:hypothetical protein